ncbi:MAG: hypothetical protein FH748_12310 [Balneolaceae bacterium]|nr:hypothetical protein [Balneolaceae bacterium]
MGCVRHCSVGNHLARIKKIAGLRIHFARDDSFFNTSGVEIGEPRPVSRFIFLRGKIADIFLFDVVGLDAAKPTREDFFMLPEDTLFWEVP